jgi:hypothetical protein
LENKINEFLHFKRAMEGIGWGGLDDNEVSDVLTSRKVTSSSNTHSISGFITDENIVSSGAGLVSDFIENT